MINQQYWNLIKVSSEENWEKYRREILEIAIRKKSPALVEIRRDGLDRYWIIDVDYSLVDEMQQVREIGCIQIDDRSEGVSKKIKNCFKDYISEFIVIGEKEVESMDSVDIRLRQMKESVENYPSIEQRIPKLMSKRF